MKESVSAAPMVGRVKPYSNVIPRQRKGSGEPVPRSLIGIRPLITLDSDALLEAAEAIGREQEGGRAALVRLKATSALAASENAIALRQELEANAIERSHVAEEELAELQPKLVELDRRLDECRPELASLLARLGLENHIGQGSLSFGDDKPMSLEELAGKHQLPPPEEYPGWGVKTGYRLLAAIGGGTVFGISLGLLTGKLELYSLRAELPWLIFWSLIGWTVMGLLGAALYPLAKSVGDQTYRSGLRLPWLKNLQLWLNAGLLAGLVIVMVLIESKVEQAGLFKALGEQSSLRGFKFEQGDLLWVSLMLVVPTLASYVVLGLREGERLAGLSQLKALRAEAKDAIRSNPEFGVACALFERLRVLECHRAPLEERLRTLNDATSMELDLAQRQRLEDMEMDAALASYDAEDLMRCLIEGRTSSGSKSARPGVIAWFRGLRGPRNTSRQASSLSPRESVKL